MASNLHAPTGCKGSEPPPPVNEDSVVSDSKPKVKRRRYTQSTLSSYFISSNADTPSSTAHLEAKEIVQSLGIHLYTNEEIKGAKGLQKEFRSFWNEKAEELCKDPSVRMGKLKSSSTAIRGAIYTSWTLHKCSFLQLRGEKLQSDLKDVYKDDTALTDVLSAVNRNIDRMKTAHATVTQIYSTASSDHDIEHDLNEGMHELRRAQDALSKSIDRRQVDINVTFVEQETAILIAGPPEQLSHDEVEQMAITINN